MAGYRKCSRTKIRAVGVICRCASVWWAGFLRVVPHGHQPQPSLQEGRHDLQPWTRPASLRGWVGGAAGGLASARRGGGGGGRWRGPDRGRDGEVRRRTHLLQISVCVLGSFGAWVCFSTLSLSLSLCSGITGSSRRWISTRPRVWTWMTRICRSCRLEPGPPPRRPWGGGTGSRASVDVWGEDCSTVRRAATRFVFMDKSVKDFHS